MVFMVMNWPLSSFKFCHFFLLFFSLGIAHCNKKVIILLDPISFSGSLLEALEVLSKRLRLIQDIPLKVSSVQPLDPGTFS